MSGKLNLNPLGNEPFPTALTPTGQYRSSTLGFHPRAKSELELPRALRRLICSFHVSRSWTLRGGKVIQAGENVNRRRPVLCCVQDKSGPAFVPLNSSR